ncbi:MAG: pyridoxal-phosphate dependent enzyme [Candidatus Bathyarchaeia archaeon]
MECHLFLSGQEPDPPTGNFLLDRLLDAKIHSTSSRAERHPAMEVFASRLRNEGHRPYVIPVGGANAIGAYGYVLGFEELEGQVRGLPKKPTILIFASSSGTTYAGLLIGKLQIKSEVQIVGIRTDLDPNPENVICGIANALVERLGIQERVRREEVHLNRDYVGEEFRVPTKEGIDALRLLWRLEGILLEPVYTGKGMAGLIDLARKGLGKTERVVFLHTGGVPATFSFPEILSQSV